jgi:glycosyltransferase involved in cell wall biosynthesis
VVLFVRSLRGRGVEKSYLDLALLLQRAGVDVHLILREDEIVFDTEALEHLYILKGSSDEERAKDLGNLLQKLMRQRRIDLLLSTNTDFIKRSGFSHPAIWYSVNMSWGYRLLKAVRLKRYFQLRKAYYGKKIVAVSEGVRHDLLHLLRIKPKRVEVIYDPYDFEAIRRLAKERVDLPVSNYIVHVGAFDRVKRHDILLKAFAKLPEDLHLLLIGEGREEPKIRRLCEKLSLQKRVHFMGWQENPYPFIKHARATVLSSESEALPRVLIESLIIGTQVVSSDCRFGPAEIVKGKRAKFLAKVNDPVDLARKISLVLKAPEKIDAEEIAPFSSEQILVKYLNLIDID